MLKIGDIVTNIYSGSRLIGRTGEVIGFREQRVGVKWISEKDGTPITSRRKISYVDKIFISSDPLMGVHHIDNKHNGWTKRDKGGNIRKSQKPYRERIVKFIDLEGEVWKDVVGYEGIYEISNLGRMRSIVRTVRHNNRVTGVQTVGGTLFSINLNRLGYAFVTLFKNGKGKVKKIHRLVAMAFIPFVEGKTYVNHINGIRNDNRVENLEWCTQAENNLHRFKLQREIQAKYKESYDFTVGNGINPQAIPDYAKLVGIVTAYYWGELSPEHKDFVRNLIEKSKL